MRRVISVERTSLVDVLKGFHFHSLHCVCSCEAAKQFWKLSNLDRLSMFVRNTCNCTVNAHNGERTKRMILCDRRNQLEIFQTKKIVN